MRALLGLTVRVAHIVANQGTPSANFTYTRHIVLQYDPGPDYVVQTWTPEYLIDPTTGSTAYNMQWITYCYLVPI